MQTITSDILTSICSHLSLKDIITLCCRTFLPLTTLSFFEKEKYISLSHTATKYLRSPRTGLKWAANIGHEELVTFFLTLFDDEQMVIHIAAARGYLLLVVKYLTSETIEPEIIS